MKNTIDVDDPKITEIDPVQKIWMFENWLADQNDSAELAKNHALLLGSFWNPEAVRQMTKEANVIESTEEDLDETTRMVRQMNLDLLKQKEQNTSARRRRHHLKG